MTGRHVRAIDSRAATKSRTRGSLLRVGEAARMARLKISLADSRCRASWTLTAT
jgi:hypothetical protein